MCDELEVNVFHYFQASKLEEHQRKYGRKKLDKELKEKQERIKRAREEHKKVRFVVLSFDISQFSKKKIYFTFLSTLNDV